MYQIGLIDWYAITVGTLQGVGGSIVSYIPTVIGAIAAMIIGWFASLLVEHLVAEALRKARFNQLFERGGLKEAMEKAEWKLDAASFVGAIAKWIVLIIFLLATVEILGFVQFADFLKRVVLWLPNVIVAVAIFIVAVVIADYLSKLIRIWLESMKLEYASLMASGAKWAVWIFAIMAILIQLGVAREIITTLFTGVVAFGVIAGGLAFGLGGKEIAGEILRDLQQKLKK